MVDNVLPLDTFIVINHTFLNDADRESLSLLYQPIAGSIAISFYLTLWSFIGNENSNHYDIVNSMQLKLEDVCIAREKLEALGLLKTYYKKGKVNEYIYELYSPLSVSEFINNPVLDTALFNNIGKQAYKQIIERFERPNVNLKEYKDISKSFKDVFSFVGSERVNNSNIIKAKHLGLDFEPTIDLKEIFELIPEEQLNLRKVNNEIKTIIYQLALVYGLDNDSMREIIIDSIGVDRGIDIEVLKNNCRSYYKFENKGQVPDILYRNQPMAWRSNTNGKTKLELQIRDYEDASPYELLKDRNGGAEPTQTDLKTVEYLVTDVKLKPGVVNVLIDYVLKINKNKFYRPLVEQIATQWVRSNINTVSDAIEIAKSEFNSTVKTVKNVKVVNKKLPDWIDKEIVSEELSEEELKELEEKMG